MVKQSIICVCILINLFLLILIDPCISQAEIRIIDTSKKQDTLTSKKNFKITLSLERNYFYELEPVFLRLVVTNISERNDSIAYLHESIMKNLTACNYRQFIGDIFYFGVPYTVFLPGDSVVLGYEINYSINEKDERTFAKSGIYFAGINLPLNDSEKTVIKSNRLRFFIFEPVKNDVLYGKILDINKELDREERLKIINDFDEHINDYLYSVYFDGLYYFIKFWKSIMGYKMDSSFVNQALQQIRRNPDSYGVSNGIWHAYWILLNNNDMTRLQEFEDEINEKFKFTKSYFALLEVKKHFKNRKYEK